MTIVPEVRILAGNVELAGIFEVPREPRGAVVFSHGSGSGRHSPRNRQVAARLQEARFATLLLDLLTPGEDAGYANRFDIGLLSARLTAAVDFVRRHESTQQLPLGLFGASTGAASALRVAAARPNDVAAIVSRGGRPDLAGDAALQEVKAPTLLVVGACDYGVIELNEQAGDRLVHCRHEIVLVPGATHLFEEPGAMQHVVDLACRWFERCLGGGGG